MCCIGTKSWLDWVGHAQKSKTVRLVAGECWRVLEEEYYVEVCYVRRAQSEPSATRTRESSPVSAACKDLSRKER